MKKISIIGSTGSIGTQTLDVIRANYMDFKVVALAAGKNITLLEKQIREFNPRFVSVWREEDAKALRLSISDLPVKVLSGMYGLIAVSTAEDADILVTAIVGMMGIQPTIAAIKQGKTIALANKETLVTAGHIIMPLAKENHAQVLPVDSEHSAIFQSLQGERQNKIDKILLTASGGIFRGKKREELQNVHPKDALKNPNWVMGRKVTIDSSTLVNKGLEVMEAHWLFGVDADRIQVVVQPQSIVHSMVQFEDGAVIAQLGTPDMKLPIQYALTYPERKYMSGKKLDFWSLKEITFEKPDTDTFYGLNLAYDALKKGGNMPTVFNAANECAVPLFLDEKIAYLEIPELILDCMENISYRDNPSIAEILDTEKEVREYVQGKYH